MLCSLYSKTLTALSQLPKEAAYRRYTEQIVQQRLQIVQAVSLAHYSYLAVTHNSYLAVTHNSYLAVTHNSYLAAAHNSYLAAAHNSYLVECMSIAPLVTSGSLFKVHLCY